MSKFWQVNEDPFYDEDGQLVDEDADWEDAAVEQDPAASRAVFARIVEELSPFETVNS